MTADSDEIDLSVVIVNLDEANWVRRCLEALEAASTDLSLEVIVVDNGSRDDSLDVARKTMPSVLLLPQDRNLGYVPANNIGLEQARGRYVLFLNNDALVAPGCLRTLVAFMDERQDVGAVSGRILNPDGTDQGTARRAPSLINAIFGRRSVLSRWFPNNRFTRSYMLGRHREDDVPFEVEILSSACLMLRTDLARSLGGMDERFQLYWVDAELCGRVRRKGFGVYCVPTAEIVHFEGSGGSTSSFRRRASATIAFHFDAYYAYVSIHQLPSWSPLRVFAAVALAARGVLLLGLQILRPGRATSSRGSAAGSPQ